MLTTSKGFDKGVNSSCHVLAATPKCSEINLMQNSHSQNLEFRKQSTGYDNFWKKQIYNQGMSLTKACPSGGSRGVIHFWINRGTCSCARSQRIIIMTWSDHHIKPVQIWSWMLYLQNRSRKNTGCSDLDVAWKKDQVTANRT